MAKARHWGRRKPCVKSVSTTVKREAIYMALGEDDEPMASELRWWYEWGGCRALIAKSDAKQPRACRCGESLFPGATAQALMSKSHMISYHKCEANEITASDAVIDSEIEATPCRKQRDRPARARHDRLMTHCGRSNGLTPACAAWWGKMASTHAPATKLVFRQLPEWRVIFWRLEAIASARKRRKIWKSRRACVKQKWCAKRQHYRQWVEIGGVASQRQSSPSRPASVAMRWLFPYYGK